MSCVLLSPLPFLSRECGDISFMFTGVNVRCCASLGWGWDAPGHIIMDGGVYIFFTAVVNMFLHYGVIAIDARPAPGRTLWLEYIGIRQPDSDSKMDEQAQSHQLRSRLVLIATGPAGHRRSAQYSWKFAGVWNDLPRYLKSWHVDDERLAVANSTYLDEVIRGHTLDLKNRFQNNFTLDALEEVTKDGWPIIFEPKLS